MMLLEVKGVSKKLEDRIVLQSINLKFEKHRKLVIAGETGSGKSTLLRMIAGLDQPTEGEIYFRGERIRGAEETLVPGHPQIAYLPQHFELQKFLRVEQVLAYANQLNRKQADETFSICQIDHLLQRKTNELSGGEKQRIALCRLLIGKPQLLLLDEPFSNLDQILKNILKQVIDQIAERLKISMVLVSHDPDDTLPWGDEFLILRHGAIVQQGNAQSIYHTPVNEYVAGLFGKYSVVPTRLFPAKGKDKYFMARPEDWKVSEKSFVNAKRAKVLKREFMGSKYVYTLQVGKTNIQVDAPTFRHGDTPDILYVKHRVSNLENSYITLEK
ncbi:MAG: ABC transporter ATP-binding protein [Bacteroidetes bacterium]|nr:ABC transporter ATP-binding protein [Bacteroidota bacterium]